MSSSNPPYPYFNGIAYNSSFFVTSGTGLTISQANAKYLQKTTPDTATALETFNGGLRTLGAVTLGTADSAISIGSNSSQTNNIVIGTKGALITGTNKVVIGEATNTLTLSSGTINIGGATSNNYIYNIESPSAATNITLYSLLADANLTLCSGQNLGSLSLGSGTGRSGGVSIMTNGNTPGSNELLLGDSAKTTRIRGTLNLNGDVNNNITIGKSGGTNTIILNRPLSLQYPTTAISTKAFCGRTTEVVQAADVSLGAGENVITGFFPTTAGVYIVNYAFRIKGASTSINMCESWFNSSLQSGVNALVQYGNHAYYSTPSSLLGSNVICQTGSAVLTLDTDTIISFKIFVSYSGTAPLLEKDFSYYSYTRLA
jgi:hypothetical protein